MTGTISGYAARYGDETTIAGMFREKLQAGCFSRSLREDPDVVALLAHDHGRVLGRVSSGTLKLRDDRIGLFFSLDADASTPSGAEAIGTVGRQDVQGCSFGMLVRAERWVDDDQSLPLRIIEDAYIYEITLTAFPAYETTSASIVSASNAASRAAAKMRARGIKI